MTLGRGGVHPHPRLFRRAGGKFHGGRVPSRTLSHAGAHEAKQSFETWQAAVGPEHAYVGDLLRLRASASLAAQGRRCAETWLRGASP